MIHFLHASNNRHLFARSVLLDRDTSFNGVRVNKLCFSINKTTALEPYGNEINSLNKLLYVAFFHIGNTLIFHVKKFAVDPK